MRTDHERILTSSGSYNPVAACFEIERKQFENMSLVVNGQNQFVCHVRILFPSCILVIWRRLRRQRYPVQNRRAAC